MSSGCCTAFATWLPPRREPVERTRRTADSQRGAGAGAVAERGWSPARPRAPARRERGARAPGRRAACRPRGWTPMTVHGAPVWNAAAGGYQRQPANAPGGVLQGADGRRALLLRGQHGAGAGCCSAASTRSRVRAARDRRRRVRGAGAGQRVQRRLGRTRRASASTGASSRPRATAGRARPRTTRSCCGDARGQVLPVC